jgi:hypothetical protein
MRKNLRKALGIAGVLVLLGTIFTAVAISLPARAAQFWQDTALSATAVTDETFGGGTLKVAGGNGVIDLSGTGVTWAQTNSFSGVSVTNTGSGSATMSYSGSAITGLSDLGVVATDGNGNAEVVAITCIFGTNSIGFTGTPVTETVTDLADTNSNNTVEFSAHGNAVGEPPNVSAFPVSNLPAGLTSSGEPTLTYSGMTAAPGTYSGVVVTAKTPYGAVLKGTFTLTVSANPITNTTYGNYVNEFGNGFDVYRQEKYPGAKIVGWTATQSDPGTHFIINKGTHPGAYQIEYAPNGKGSGFCVSDPGGGVPSDPLRDGLVLVHCNSGAWQQFIRESNGALKNVATGLYVNPHGTGAQLRGESSTTSWGGSSYSWKPYVILP